MLCPRDKCSHFMITTKYTRKCYYGPQCWKGWVDLIVFVIRKRVGR